MAGKRKVIITCAVTGAIHTPSMSDALPVTAGEIADAAIGAAEAGAAIVHLHARDPEDGRPDQSAEAFSPFLGVIDCGGAGAACRGASARGCFPQYGVDEFWTVRDAEPVQGFQT